jgi:hypothetical protein
VTTGAIAFGLPVFAEIGVMGNSADLRDPFFAFGVFVQISVAAETVGIVNKAPGGALQRRPVKNYGGVDQVDEKMPEA